MKTNKTSSVTTTITPTMQLVNKTNNQVISSSGTTMTANSSQFIFFSISDIISSEETLTSYKLKFIQNGNSNDDLTLYKSNASRIISSSGYKMKYVNDGVQTYREVDITDAMINANGQTLYFAIVCNSSAGVRLYTSLATPNVYRPSKMIDKVLDNDFVKNQKFLTGQTNEADQYNINIRNGKLHYQINLVSTYAEYLPTNLNIQYNPSYYDEIFEPGLPKGWKFNYFQKVTQSGLNYVYVDGQFKKHTFVLADNLTTSSTDEVYYESDGNYLILKINTSSSTEYYEINDESNNSLFFNSSGLLTKISAKVSDDKEYLTTLEYNSFNQLIKIKDGCSDETEIEYSSNKIEIRKPNGKIVTLNLDIEDCLSSIVFPDSSTTTFEYTQTSAFSRAVIPDIPIVSYTLLLNKIKSINKQVSFEYFSDSKIIEKFKEEYIDLSTNTTHIDKSYILKYSKLRTFVECHPYTNYASNGKSSYFMYTFDENGEIVGINETNGVNILSSKLFKRNQAGTVMASNADKPYMYLNEMFVLTAATGSVEVNDITYNDLDLTQLEDFEEEKQFTLIFEYSLNHVRSLEGTTSSDLYLEVKEGNKVLGRIDLNPDKEFRQEVFLTFETKCKTPSVVIVNRKNDIALDVFGLSIFEGAHYDPKLLTNIEAGQPVLFDSKILYYAPSFNIGCTIAGSSITKTNIEQSYSDFVRNKENCFKSLKNNKSTFNVWYNDGQNMLYNVTSLNYIFGQNSKPIQELEVVNFSGDKNFYKGEYFIYDFTDFSRKHKIYSIAKNFDHSVKFLEKTIDDYGFITTETNEKQVTIDYTITDGLLTRQKIKNKNSHYNNLNTDNDLIIDYGYNNNRQESVKNYYQSNIIGEKFTYDVMGNVLKVYDINDASTPLINNTYGTTSSELLDKIIFDKSLNDEVTTLSYDNKKVATLSHSSNPVYNFLYDFRNNIKEIKVAGDTICTIDYTCSANEISKTINYENGEKEKLTYNKYGKLTKLERAKDDISFETIYTIKHYSYDKNCKEIEETNSGFIDISSNDSNESIKIQSDSLGNKTIDSRSKYNDYVATKEASSFAIPSGLQKVVSISTKETKVDYELNSNEIMCSTSVDKTMANQLYKEVYLFNNQGQSTLFKESLIEEKLGRCFNKTHTFSNVVFDSKYQFSPSEYGTSNYISKELFTFDTTSKEIAYTYDNKSNIKTITGDNTVSYEYDEYNRLTRENNAIFNATYTYQYDIYGNIVSKNKYTYTTNDIVLDTLQSTTSYSYDTGNKTLLTGFNSSAITYDELNQPITFKGNTLSWSFGKLVQYGNNTYDYSMVGKRIKKSTSNQNIFFIYDGDRLIREDRYDQYGNHTRINYIYGNKDVIGFRYESNGVYIDYYYRKNMFGDVIGLYYNSNGYVVTSALYFYDAWGNCKVTDVNGNDNTSSTFIGNINPIRYRSYYYDVETKLYWVSSRYYSPELCRWISPDSIEYLDPESINGLNLYAYCMNNPIMYADPSGHSAILIGLIIGAIIGFGTAAYIDYQDDGQIFNGSVAWYDYLGATVLGGAIGAGLGAFAGMSFSASIPTFGWINSGGALMFGITGTMAVTVTGAQVLGVAGVLGGIYMFAKTSRQPGKVTSSDKPSWVNESMVDPNKTAQQNAKDILDWKYGPGNWPKGPGTEYNKIVKWIERYLRYYRGW